MDQIKIFVINLKRSPERRNEIDRLMANYELKFEFFEAIDGTTLSQEIIDKSRERSNYWYKLDEGPEESMKLGEIGVAMSHYNLYQRIISEKLFYAIILEDDAYFEEKFEKFVRNKKKIDEALIKFDLILLGYCTNDLNYETPAVCAYIGRLKLSNDYYVGIPIKWYWSAIGYIINQKGAKLLAEKQGEFPCVTADILTANSPQYGVKLGTISSPLITPGKLSNLSTIQNHEIKISKIYTKSEDYTADWWERMKKGKVFLNKWLKEQKLKTSIKQYLFIKSKY